MAVASSMWRLLHRRARRARCILRLLRRAAAAGREGLELVLADWLGGWSVSVGCSADDAVGVHGRAAELARIGHFLDEVAGGPVALLIEGAAGIGKTALWSAGIEMARERGWWVLTCRPVQSEVAHPPATLAGHLDPSRPQRRLANACRS